MKLTEHQEEKCTEGIDTAKENNRLIIRGSAGVGKTTLMNELIIRLKDEKVIPHFNIVCSAPTHKALAILSEKVDVPMITYQTVQSVLCYGHEYDKNTGNSIFKPKINPKYPPLQNTRTLIIDESSMINLEMLMYLEKYGHKTKIIFVGDDKQLNPVGEQESPIFWGKPKLFDTVEEAFQYTFQHRKDTSTVGEVYCPEYNKKFVGFKPYPEIELTEIVRQGADNPIIPLSRNISSIWDYKQRLTENGHGFLYANNYDKVIEELALVNGSDDLKYLSYTNEDVDKVNFDVRQKIYNFPRRLELGESIIFDAPYGDTYKINQELKIETLDIDTIVFTQPVQNAKGIDFMTEDIALKCYILNGEQIDEFGTGELVWQGVFVIHEDSDKAFKDFYSKLQIHCKKGLLDQPTRRRFDIRFAKFKYNHALTVHKSQGSTYRRTILNVGCVNLNPQPKEKERMFYTGITRTKELLILYNVK